jgi:quercetin dioxygenase-like cupin family protein
MLDGNNHFVAQHLITSYQQKGIIMGRPQASSHLQIDNHQVIVTRWDFSLGAETGWHRHEHDYVIIPISDGKMLLETPEGDREAVLKAGVGYNRVKGTEHNVINIGNTVFRLWKLN